MRGSKMEVLPDLMIKTNIGETAGLETQTKGV